MVAGIEEVRHLSPGIGMRPAHEAVADHSDVHFFWHSDPPVRLYAFPSPLSGGARGGVFDAEIYPRRPRTQPLRGYPRPKRGRGFALALPQLLPPAVRVAHLDHRAEHVVPRLLPLHHGVREHAAVPADVAHALGELA